MCHALLYKPIIWVTMGLYSDFASLNHVLSGLFKIKVFHSLNFFFLKVNNVCHINSRHHLVCVCIRAEIRYLKLVKSMLLYLN